MLESISNDKHYTIAIVGKPNVGKSTLFNRLCKKRKSIVDEQAGVTRDFQIETIYWNDTLFDIIDTSGFEIKKNDELRRLMDDHYRAILNRSDAFLFLCDGQSAVTQLDHDLLSKIRKENKPTLYAVNKIDSRYFRNHPSEFFELLGTSFESISAEQGRGIGELLKRFEKQFELTQGKKEILPPQTRVVIMGRPNAGKSTLLNRLLNQQRALVSAIPGTTRDPIDSEINVGQQRYLLIDTAGLRKKRNIHEKIEQLSTQRAIGALKRADFLLLLIDAVEGPSDQDIKISNLAWQRGVGILILINKWDLLPASQRTNTHWERLLGHHFRMFHRLPLLFISALEGRNINTIFPMIDDLKKARAQVLDPEEVQRNFASWVHKTPPPFHKLSRNKRAPIRFYHCRQIDHAPPVFEIQTNRPKQIPEAYDQFLKAHFRETFGFWGIPIDIRYKRIH